MKVESVGEEIASRRFALLRDEQEPAEVLVRMGKPQPFPDHQDYYCPYEIKSPLGNRIMAIAGIDAFQAMQLALDTIGVELYVIARDSGGRLVWDGDDKGDLGFPLPDWGKQ